MNGIVDFKDGYENLLKAEYPEIYQTYSADVYTDRVNTILDGYSGGGSNPFYMYFAHQLVHDPFEVPQEYIDMYQGWVQPPQIELAPSMADSRITVSNVFE